MNVIPSLVADRKPTVLGEPCQRALHNPPVSPRLLGTLRTLPSYAPLDASSSERPRALLVNFLSIVGFVGVQLPGALSWPASSGTLDRLYSVDRLFKDHRVAHVGGSNHCR